VILALFGALLIAQAPGEAGVRPFNPNPLSPFRKAKAEWLLRHRLPCLGCHELDGQGGRIGPSFSEVKRLRSADYVYWVIRLPGSIMPRVPMSQATIELIASYLGQRVPTPGASRSVRAPAIPASDAAEPGRAPALYGLFCAPCHGVRGGGDGYNAPFLPVRPTAHADSAYMSGRSDDALFDAIYAGGYVMNRSNLMPPFGGTLTRDHIWDLTRYLRTLCRCEGPAWSRDNAPNQ